MTIWQRIRQGVAVLSLDTAVSLLTGVIGARLVFQYLSVADYGQLALYISFYTIGAVFLDLGMTDVFVAEIARARGSHKPDWARFLIGRYSILVMSAATLMLVVFVVIGAQRRDTFIWSAIGAYLWLSALNLTATTLFHSTTRYRRVAGQSITRNCIRLLLRATLPWWWGRQQQLVGVMLVYPMTEAALTLLSAFLARGAWAEFRGLPTAHHTLRDLVPLITDKGVYAALTLPVKRVMAQLPVWLITSMAGAAALGAYAAAEEAYILIFSFFGSLETTLLPLVSEQGQVSLATDANSERTSQLAQDRVRVALRQAQKYTFWLGLGVAIAGIIGGRWLILWIAGESYLVALPLLRLFLLLLPLNAFAQSHRPILHAVGAQKWILLLQVASTILQAVLLPIGIWAAKATGAVWAVLVRSLGALAMGQAVVQHLAPELWIDPRGVVRIEEFDRRLWQALRQRLGFWRQGG